MPKGYKSKHGYFHVAHLPGADDFKQIATKCNDAGIQMSSSNARRILLCAMMKIAGEVQKTQQVQSTNAELYEIVRTPAFQAGLADMLNEKR